MGERENDAGFPLKACGNDGREICGNDEEGGGKDRRDVGFDPAFDPEFDALPAAVQDELLAQAKLLETFGPTLGRPRVDTLKGSRHANMKELRFQADNGAWRVAFAFDFRRKAILLVVGDKSGVNERRFYRQVIKKADERFDAHLDRLKDERKSR